MFRFSCSCMVTMRLSLKHVQYLSLCLEVDNMRLDAPIQYQIQYFTYKVKTIKNQTIMNTIFPSKKKPTNNQYNISIQNKKLNNIHTNFLILTRQTNKSGIQYQLQNLKPNNCQYNTTI